MSGGSFNYLYSKDISDLIECGTLNDMDNMVSRLTELGFLDAAKETLGLKICIQLLIESVITTRSRLNVVWKSVEWFDSNDYGIEAVNEAIEKYRKNKE